MSSQVLRSSRPNGLVKSTRRHTRNITNRAKISRDEVCLSCSISRKLKTTSQSRAISAGETFRAYVIDALVNHLAKQKRAVR